MKDELVFVKSNYINNDFKKVGEYINPDSDKFDRAIEHKIYVSLKDVESIRDNKKMLCSFLTIRVIGDNTLMTFAKDKNKKCVVLDIPVTRGMFKRNPNELAFVEAVKDYLLPFLSPQSIRQTHLYVSGVINHDVVFGIHYTLFITPDIEKQLKKSDFPNGKSYRISKLQSDSSLDGISQLCINNYKEAISDGKNT